MGRTFAGFDFDRRNETLALQTESLSGKIRVDPIMLGEGQGTPPPAAAGVDLPVWDVGETAHQRELGTGRARHQASGRERMSR